MLQYSADYILDYLTAHESTSLLSLYTSPIESQSIGPGLRIRMLKTEGLVYD